MDAISKKTPEPRHCIFVDAVPEDEERQDELNRTMRKPGDPPYNPNAKWLDPANSTPSSGQTEPPAGSQKS
jgi:hypothetical protein